MCIISASYLHTVTKFASEVSALTDSSPVWGQNVKIKFLVICMAQIITDEHRDL